MKVSLSDHDLLTDFVREAVGRRVAERETDRESVGARVRELVVVGVRLGVHVADGDSVVVMVVSRVMVV